MPPREELSLLGGRAVNDCWFFSRLLASALPHIDKDDQSVSFGPLLEAFRRLVFVDTF